MSKLNELIKEFCPDGVEYKPLEKCCNILDRHRKPVTKSARETGVYPYYGANGIQDYVSDYIFDGTFVLVGEDGSVMTKNGNPVVTWAEGKIWVNNHAHIIEEVEGALLRYLYHYIQTVNVTPLIHGNIPKLTGGYFKAISIPLPPLPVQREIVHILDKFTELTVELTVELTARKKQYEYYRDSLLTFSDKFEWKALGGITRLSRGVRVIRSQLNDQGKYPVYQNSMTPLGYYDKSNCQTKTTFVISAGAAGSVGYSDVDFWAADDCYCLVCSEDLDSRYLYHALSNQQDYIFSQVRRASVPRIGRDVIERIQIPIPYPNDIKKSLAEQQRIVNILDRFNTLCNDISNGLPAEIKARQQQCEYYRDKLLTLPKAELEV